MKKYVLIFILLAVSIVFNIFLRGIKIDVAFSSILFQLLGSLVLGYVISMFVAKYRENDWVRYWKIMYSVMVIVSVLAHYSNLLPPTS